jgi:hypothetical protein
MLAVEVRQMLGIAIPPVLPDTSAGGSIWPGVIAGVVLLVVLAAAIWTYVRSRPTDTIRHVEDFQLPKAA